MEIIRTDSKNIDFINLVKELDSELAKIDGEDHAFYNQFNSIDSIQYALVAIDKNRGIACGAIKRVDDSTMEIKRMYTRSDMRGKGIATKVLSALELWAKELGYAACILETGKRQQDAIALYKKSGYLRIANYGPYIDVENSVCFKKEL